MACTAFDTDPVTSKTFPKTCMPSLAAAPLESALRCLHCHQLGEHGLRHGPCDLQDVSKDMHAIPGRAACLRTVNMRDHLGRGVRSVAPDLGLSIHQGAPDLGPRAQRGSAHNLHVGLPL